ncbi:uncharacterized protein IAS62_005735 [Cryptococcus decagattii]|uniref:Uncharacterized protein n=1 Tax=Cryptococcus decagattii TaxID=1859122 RepID=A0ABZ2B0P2_9TREE
MKARSTFPLCRVSSLLLYPEFPPNNSPSVMQGHSLNLRKDASCWDKISCAFCRQGIQPNNSPGSAGGWYLAVKVDIYNLSQPADLPSRQFRVALTSSHHVSVMNNLLRQREALYGVPQPFLNVAPHRFGLIPRQPPGEFDGDPEKRYKFLKESPVIIHEKHRRNEEEDKDGIGSQLSVDEDCLFLGVTLNGDADVLVDPESLVSPDPRTPSPRKRSLHTAS